MDEKATLVKNLSWQDGYVSSIDGVTIAGAEDNRAECPECPEKKKEQNPEENRIAEEDKQEEEIQKEDKSQQQQQHKQKEHQNQQDQEQQFLQPTMEGHRISLPSKQPTVSILKTTSPACEVDGIYAYSTMPQRYQSTDTKSYNIDKPWSSSNDKENNLNKDINKSYTSTSGFSTSADTDTNANKLSLFEQEYQRKLQLMRSNAKKKEEKLFVLLNRNAGVITHVIRPNPKYLRK